MANYYQKVYDQGSSQWCYYVDTVINPTPLPGDTQPNWVGPISDHCVIRVETSGGVVDHGLLTGLGDDDHTQYLLANGARALSGNLAVNTNITIDGRDISADGAALDLHIASTSNPHGTSIANIGSGTLAQLNAAISDADVVPTTRTVTAGAGLTGGGALSGNITFNVGAHADGSIVVAADTVQVGVLATDAQHGARGGGTQHAVATTSVAGFMSSADKTKLDGIATSATNTPLSNAIPVSLGAATAGVSTLASRADHRHPHGDQAGGTLHAVATTSVAGFLSAADKIKLDGIASGAVADHGALTGLSDDDHTQYLLVDGTRAMSAPLVLPHGSAAAPTLTFNSNLNLGFYRRIADQIGVAVGGTSKWAFAGAVGASLLYSLQERGAIVQNIDHGYLDFAGRQTTLTDPSILLRNVVNYSGSSGTQKIVGISGNFSPQTLTAGWTALTLDVTDTGTGTGDKRFIDAQLGGVSQFAVTSGGLVLAASGTASAPGYAFLGDADSGVYRIAADTLGFATGGVERWRISATGILYANGATAQIRQFVANTPLNLCGNITNATHAGAVEIINSGAFTGTGPNSQRHLRVVSAVNQTSSASGFSALQVDVANTALGSGPQYLLDLQVGGTTVAAITNESVVGDGLAGRLLVSGGSAAAPGLASVGAPTSGFFANGSSIGVSYLGTERWRFGSNTIYAIPTGESWIQAMGANSRLTIGGRQDHATNSTNPSLKIAQYANLPFVGNNISQTMVRIESILNQQGAASFVALDVATTNTALGSGDQRLLSFKVDGTEVFGIRNAGTTASPSAAAGQLLARDGSAATPSLSFLSDSDTGIYWSSSDTYNLAAGGIDVLRITAPFGANPQVLVASGSEALPSVAFTGDSTSGMYLASSGTVGVVTGGTQRLSISSTAITAEVPVHIPDGSDFAPSLAFGKDTDTGIYRIDSGRMGLVSNGFVAAEVAPGPFGPQLRIMDGGAPTGPAFTFNGYNDTHGLYIDADEALGVAAGGIGLMRFHHSYKGITPGIGQDASVDFGHPSFRWNNTWTARSNVLTGSGNDASNASSTITAKVSVTSNADFTAITIPTPSVNSVTQIRVNAVAISATGSGAAAYQLYMGVHRQSGVLYRLAPADATSDGITHIAIDNQSSSEQWFPFIRTSGTNIVIGATKASGSTTVRWQFTIEYQSVTTTG